MANIKFSHRYPKLWGQKRAELLDVRIVSYYNLKENMIEYDTNYDDNGSLEHYELPKTNLILLTFRGEDLIPFTTLRRHTVEKFKYYKDLEGEWFDIIVA